LPFESIYASYKNADGKWQEPERLEFNSNTRHDAVASTSPGGQKLFIFRSGKGNGDLYRAHLEGAKDWTEPKKMGSDINSDALEPHGVLSPNGETFYFVSNRDGGKGGRDIYRCKKLPTGDWSKAQNLGSTINTQYDEDACFIHPNGKTLYFSSNGHKTMGGYDIMYSEKKKKGGWTEPTNMGFPINTVDNDRFFATSADGKRGYYASEKEDGLGARDIYQVQLKEGKEEKLTVLKGFINVPEGQNIPDKTKIKATSKATGKTYLFRPRERDGVFVSILPPCHDYKMEYMVGNEVFNTETVTIPCESSYQEINKEIYLNPVKLGESKVVDKGVSRKRKWKVLKGEKALDRSGVVVKYIGEDGNVMFTESVKKDGSFAYYKLPKQEAYRFKIETNEPHLCQELELVLVNNKGKELARTERTERCNFVMKEGSLALKKDEGKKSDDEKGKETKKGGDKTAMEDKSSLHKRIYDYNQKGLDKKNSDYQKFLKEVKQIVDEKGKAKVTIRGSASKVPTKTFDSNEALAKKRVQDAEKDLKKDLKEKGVSLSDLEFTSQHKVQGPPYTKGNIQPKEEYMEHQYVRIQVD
ncbi:MAG: TolB family protein, partial [Flavobacteriales bacterium]